MGGGGIRTIVTVSGFEDWRDRCQHGDHHFAAASSARLPTHGHPEPRGKGFLVSA
jgi:hypothetical protein